MIALLASAQDPTQANVQKKVVREEATQVKAEWKKLTLDGKEITVLRAFDKKGCPDRRDRMREIALLDLSEDQYQEFLKGATAFVNKYKIFSCDVTGEMEQFKRSKKIEPAPTGGDPRVTVIHEPDCGGVWY